MYKYGEVSIIIECWKRKETGRNLHNGNRVSAEVDVE
jgi:hypothetical protein